MDLKEKMKEFNQRWNVSSGKSYQEEFHDFRTRVLNIFWNEIDNFSNRIVSIYFASFLESVNTIEQSKITYYEYPQNWNFIDV